MMLLCRFCAQPTKEAFILSPELISFLEEFLKTPPGKLSVFSCKECRGSASTARAFRLKYEGASEKMDIEGPEGGRGRRLRRARGGTDYDLMLHGPLMFPRVNMTTGDRARAELHLAGLSSSLEDNNEAAEETNLRSESGDGTIRAKKKIQYMDEEGNLLPTKIAKEFPGKR